MTLTVPCLFGLESLVADEMKRLQLQNVRAENGRVHCEGSMADIARLNINLRCGARVLMELGSFPAKDFEALFQGVLALPWEDFIPRDGEFPVKGYSLNSTLHSVPACQAIVKKASAKRLGNAYGCETLPETGSRYQIQFAIIKDQATLYLDTSGEGLYKRGYRARNMGAPLRETLAAALVTLSRYRGKDPFCDPFCGSGTIPIEAALIAKNRAPGLDRSFAAQKWKNMDSQLWLDAADEAMDREFHGTYDIWGGEFAIAEAGLYFYYFHITTQDGAFRLFKQGDDANMEAGDLWQVSCIPEDFYTPQWAKGAIIYQIFPDRFCKRGEVDLWGKLQPYTIHEDWYEEVHWQPDS